MDTLTHKCPGPGCEAQVRSSMLMCRADWYRVPKTLRDDLWAAWDGGRGSGSEEHRDAMLAAIGSLTPGGHDAE